MQIIPNKNGKDLHNPVTKRKSYHCRKSLLEKLNVIKVLSQNLMHRDKLQTESFSTKQTNSNEVVTCNIEENGIYDISIEIAQTFEGTLRCSLNGDIIATHLLINSKQTGNKARRVITPNLPLKKGQYTLDIELSPSTECTPLFTEDFQKQPKHLMATFIHRLDFLKKEKANSVKQSPYNRI